MFGVLQNSMTTAFVGEFCIGALVAFVVTVSGIQLFGIGAAFWGLVFGYAISAALEREAFRNRITPYRTLHRKEDEAGKTSNEAQH